MLLKLTEAPLCFDYSFDKATIIQVSRQVNVIVAYRHGLAVRCLATSLRRGLAGSEEGGDAGRFKFRSVGQLGELSKP